MKVFRYSLSFLLLLMSMSTLAVPLSPQPYKLQVFLSKKEATLGELLNITVKVTFEEAPAKDIVLGLELRDPKGIPKYIGVKKTDDNGVATFLIRISLNWTKGKYKVYVAISGTSIKKIVEFNVIARPGFKYIKCVSANGTPLKGAMIILYDAYGVRRAYISTNLKGVASLFIYPGIYTIKVIWRGAYVYQGIIEIDKKNITVVCRVYDLKIIVKEKYTGRAISDKKIIVWSPEARKRYEAYTDKDGAVMFKLLPESTYEIIYDKKKLIIDLTENKTVVIELEPSLLWILPYLLILIVPLIIYIIKEIVIKKRKRQ